MQTMQTITRSQLLRIADALGSELTFEALYDFLPPATLSAFVEDLRNQADIEDLLS